MPELMCESCGIRTHELRIVDVGGYRLDLCRACAGSLKFPEADGGFEELRDREELPDAEPS